MARPRKVSDEQIITATRDALLEQGPGASVANIAARLGVSAPAILKRMGSRDELLARALCPQGPPDWLVRLDEPVSEAELPGALVEILVDAMEFLARLIPLLVLMRTAQVQLEIIAERPQAPGEQLRRALTTWIERSRGRPRRADPEPAAFVEAVLGAVEARCFHAYLQGRGVPNRRRELSWARSLVAGLWPRLAC